MAVDKSVDSAQLDAALSAVADAIRSKGGTEAALSFPAGFVSAVEALGSGGGQGYSLLASGSYTKTDAAVVPSRLEIPVSFSGTPVCVFVCAQSPLAENQTLRWFKQFEPEEELASRLGFPMAITVYKPASGNPYAAVSDKSSCSWREAHGKRSSAASRSQMSNSSLASIIIRARRVSAPYHVQVICNGNSRSQHSRQSPS